MRVLALSGNRAGFALVHNRPLAGPVPTTVETDPPAFFSPDLILSELNRVLESETFVRARGLGRFLRFVVEQSVDGRQNEIKEYVIGLEVFDRGHSFDQRIDTVVRVGARRLRAKLREYYETEGRRDPLRIDIPKGSYAPAFREWGGGAAGPAPAVAVLPFFDFSRDDDGGYFCDGLTDELITALASVPGLRVASRTSSFAFKNTQLPVRDIADELNVHAILEGSVRRTADRLRVAAQLVNVFEDARAWSATYDRTMSNGLDLQSEIAQEIVGALRPHLGG